MGFPNTPCSNSTSMAPRPRDTDGAARWITSDGDSANPNVDTLYDQFVQQPQHLAPTEFDMPNPFVDLTEQLNRRGIGYQLVNTNYGGPLLAIDCATPEDLASIALQVKSNGYDNTRPMVTALKAGWTDPVTGLEETLKARTSHLSRDSNDKDKLVSSYLLSAANINVEAEYLKARRTGLDEYRPLTGIDGIVDKASRALATLYGDLSKDSTDKKKRLMVTLYLPALTIQKADPAEMIKQKLKATNPGVTMARAPWSSGSAIAAADQLCAQLDAWGICYSITTEGSGKISIDIESTDEQLLSKLTLATGYYYPNDKAGYWKPINAPTITSLAVDYTNSSHDGPIYLQADYTNFGSHSRTKQMYANALIGNTNNSLVERSITAKRGKKQAYQVFVPEAIDAACDTLARLYGRTELVSRGKRKSVAMSLVFRF